MSHLCVRVPSPIRVYSQTVIIQRVNHVCEYVQNSAPYVLAPALVLRASAHTARCLTASHLLPSPALSALSSIFNRSLHYTQGTGDGRAAHCQLHRREIRRALEAGEEVNSEDAHWMTALLYASCGGHVDAVLVLLKAGAALGLLSHEGLTALMLASGLGHENVVRVLLEAGARVDCNDHNEHTALMYAGVNGHTGVVQVLLEAGARVDCNDHNGQTALMYAGRNGHESTMRVLMAAMGATENMNKRRRRERIPQAEDVQIGLWGAHTPPIVFSATAPAPAAARAPAPTPAPAPAAPAPAPARAPPAPARAPAAPGPAPPAPACSLSRSAVPWQVYAARLSIDLPWVTDPLKWHRGIQCAKGDESYILRRAFTFDLGTFSSRKRAELCAHNVMHLLKGRDNHHLSIAQIGDMARRLVHPPRSTPGGTASHHHSYAIRQIRATDPPRYSLNMRITRTWGHFESKKMAGFAAAVLDSGVPDSDLRQKLDQARGGLDLGPVATPPPPPCAPTAPPTHSLSLTALELPPLRPVAVDPMAARVPAEGGGPAMPPGDPLALLAGAAATAGVHPGPGSETVELDHMLRQHGDLASPATWVALLSKMCAAIPDTVMPVSAIAAVASKLTDFTRLTQAPRGKGRGGGGFERSLGEDGIDTHLL